IATSAATVLYGCLWIGYGLREPYWAIAMLAASVILAELGVRSLPREFVGASIAMNLIGLVTLTFTDTLLVAKSPAVPVLASFGGAAFMYYWLAWRSHSQRTDLGRIAGVAATALGTYFTWTTIWMTIADPFVLPIYT